MSEDHNNGASTIRPAKTHDEGGGAGKWLIGAVAAVVLLGGGYLVMQSLGSPSDDEPQTAFNDFAPADPFADESMRTDPIGPADDASAIEEPVAEPASADAAPTPAPRRRAAPSRTEPVPEEVIGVMPINATETQSDELVITGVRRPLWTRTPSARRLSELYPERALNRGREGEASLHCTVLESGQLDCVRASETPGGFGGAAMRVASRYRHATTLADGSSAVGTPVNLRVLFRIEGEHWRG